jgi:hypothetical protein
MDSASESVGDDDYDDEEGEPMLTDEAAAGALLHIHQSPQRESSGPYRSNASPYPKRDYNAIEGSSYDDVKSYYASSSMVAPNSSQSNYMGPPSARAAKKQKVFNGGGYSSPLSEGASTSIGQVHSQYHLFQSRHDGTPTMGSNSYADYPNNDPSQRFAHPPSQMGGPGGDASGIAGGSTAESHSGVDPEFMKSPEMESLRQMTGGRFLDDACARLVKAIFETTTTTHLVRLIVEVTCKRSGRMYSSAAEFEVNDSMPFAVPPRSEFEVDIALDENNNTALHYAAALGRVQIISALRSMGAKLACIDRNGETPLMKTVQHPYCWQLRNFPSVLELLLDSLWSADLDGRTVLHVSISSCLKGPMESAGTYYDQEIAREAQRLALTNSGVAPSGGDPDAASAGTDDMKAKVAAFINGKTRKGATPNGYALFHKASADALARFSQETGIALVTQPPSDDALNEMVRAWWSL